MTSFVTKQNNRLLIVDDNRAIHEDFRKILGPKLAANEGFEATKAALFGEEPAQEPVRSRVFHLDSAYQGMDALALVKTGLENETPYAMAFMDVRMPPGWDGVETTTRIWEVDPDIQIVICSAYSDCSWDEMLSRLQASDRLVILKKPFDHIEVIQLANSLTKKWQLLQQAKLRRAQLEDMVEARTRQLAREQEKIKALFENSPDGIFQTSPDGRILSANPALAGIYGYSSTDELLKQLAGEDGWAYVDPQRGAELKNRIETEGIVRQFESEITCRDGSRKWVNQTACKVADAQGAVHYHQGFVVDITARKEAEKDRNLMEVHLRQAQKLESVGHLAAGIAHEINTPTQYLGDNVRFLEECFADLLELLTEEQKLAAAFQANAVTPELLDRVTALRQKTDIAYLGREIPGAIRQSLDGIGRISNIVRAMKEFSHPGNTQKTAIDLNHAIETTLLVSRNEWKYVANVVTELDPDLPLVPCLPGEFNQVILNLVVNAAHAISDVSKGQEGAKGTIKITTRCEGGWIEVRISDSGTGIPKEIQHRIFEPFFTTKGVGKGTGQGLAIARSTIINKHGGQLAFETFPGKGTTFIIRLPASPAPTADTESKP